MEYRYLGQTGLKVSRLCFGALTIGPLQSNLPLKEGAEVIRKAIDLGVNFIDTAELYGTYEYIREALRGRSERVYIASKSYAYERDAMKKSLEKARKALDRDVIDIFLLHEQESALTLKGHWEAFEYLLEAKAKNIIKAVGISTHRIAGVVAASRTPEIDVIHPLINKSGLGIHDGTAEEMLDAIKDAYSLGKGIYGMKCLGGGNLINQRQEAFEFILGQQELAAVAVGMKSLQEAQLNIKIFAGEKPSQAEFKQVDLVNRRLHIEEWCQGCNKCIERCKQKALSNLNGKVIVNSQTCVLCGYCGCVCPEFCIKIV